MTALTAFWRNETPEPPSDAAPAPLRIAHGISALGIITLFLARARARASRAADRSPDTLRWLYDFDPAGVPSAP